MSDSLTHLENCYHAMLPAAEKSDEAFAWFSDIPNFIFNAVMHLSCENVSEKVDALIGQVSAGNLISFWVHPGNRAESLVDILEDKGFAPVLTCPLMFWPVQAIEAKSADIRSTQNNMDVFNDITSAVFHFDEITKEKYAHILTTLASENYLLYVNGKPVATGLLYVNGHVGGVFNIAVLPEQQCKGYGEAMMKFLMQRAHALQLKELVLLSSPDGKKLYSNLGFKKVYDIEMYARNGKVDPAASERAYHLKPL